MAVENEVQQRQGGVGVEGVSVIFFDPEYDDGDE